MAGLLILPSSPVLTALVQQLRRCLMTPSELLLAAADRLETLARDANSITSPHEEAWYVVGEGGATAPWSRFADENPEDAAFIATMDPSVALAVAAWLRETGEAAALQERLNLSPLANVRALAVARAVLRDQEKQP